MIDKDDKTLSVVRQCALLKVTRSSLYYHPSRNNNDDLTLMALIDRQFLEMPCYGSRKMTAWLRLQGHAVNRKRVRRLMRERGLTPIYQKPRTSQVTASVMGRWESSPPNDTLAAGPMLPSVVGPGAATPCCQREPESRSHIACSPSVGRVHQQLPGFIGSRVPATGPWGEDRPALPETSSSLGGDGFLSEAEVGPIPPHTMQNGGELAGQGHLGALHAATLGHRQRPPLER